MAFGDQIYRQTNITTSQCHGCETRFIKMPIVCHPPLTHKTRRQSLFSAIERSMKGGSLSITGLGRDIENQAMEKHKIKRVDRLCSNGHLHRDIEFIYTRMTYLLVGKMKQPIIHIDWSDLDDRKQHFLIRASLAAQGRSLTLYEEIHPLNKKEKPKTHLLFLKKLNHILMPFIGFSVYLKYRSSC